MAREIERKFLLRDERWRDAVTCSTRMCQGYLERSPTVSIRVRVAGAEAWINLKSATLGVARHEFEYAIPRTDADEMLALFCGEHRIDKTRHHVPWGDHLWEIDEFHGANAGLVVAEIELDAEDEVFAAPPWIGADVSHDRRYYNVCLVDYPYTQW